MASELQVVRRGGSVEPRGAVRGSAARAPLTLHAVAAVERSKAATSIGRGRPTHLGAQKAEIPEAVSRRVRNPGAADAAAS